jgi:hypothetical protein
MNQQANSSRESGACLNRHSFNTFELKSIKTNFVRVILLLMIAWPFMVLYFYCYTEQLKVVRASRGVNKRGHAARIITKVPTAVCEPIIAG